MNQWEKAVYETGFAMDDILLYLDTHPQDREALAYYEKVREDWMRARCAYVSKVGPLTFDDVTGVNKWTWIERPWPWEGGMSTCGPTRNACNSR
jgi:spore coat protein JB